MTAPPAIPLPTDITVPEYDAPPPAGVRSLTPAQIAHLPTRPASRIVNIPSVRATVGVLPDYDAPAPALPARGR